MERFSFRQYLTQHLTRREHGYDSDELLQAHVRMSNQTFSFINPMSLKCAIELGILDIIQNHGHPMTHSELVSALPIHPGKTRFVYSLMQILINSGFVRRQKLSETNPSETNQHLPIHSSSLSDNPPSASFVPKKVEVDEEEGYVLTSASWLLLKDNPLSVIPFLLAMLSPILTQPWHHLGSWFQNDDPTPFYMAHGMTFWDYWRNKPSLAPAFNDAMTSDTRLISKVVIDECKEVFEGVESLIDVGGGMGTMARAIADAFPHMDCTVFDLPHVVADMQGTNNLKYAGGNMFETLPTADAILLKWILHDWNDEDCVKILERCKKAITSCKEKKGKVIIIDMVVGMENQNGDEESLKMQISFDMLMMVLLPGKERNEKEWAKLFSDAGFSNYKITPSLGSRSLIEVYP